MCDFLTEHQIWAAVAAYWILSAAVCAMPEPASTSSAGYLWLYRFLHTLAGNISTAFSSRIRLFNDNPLPRPPTNHRAASSSPTPSPTPPSPNSAATSAPASSPSRQAEAASTTN